MSIQNPFFSDRFSLKDYRTVGALRQGFRWGEHYKFPHFEPILLNPGGTYWRPRYKYVIGSSGSYRGQEFAAMEFCTTRWNFAERVYAQALKSTRNRFPQLTNIQWEEFLPNWRKLLLPDCFADAADFLAAEMERVTRSGLIHVETGCSLIVDPVKPEYPNDTVQSRTKLRVTLDAGELSEAVMKPLRFHKISDFEAAVPRKTAHLTWNDIARLVYRPTPGQIELINHWDARPIPREIDLQMIEKVSHLDLEGASELIDRGANVNACDQYGETTLTALAQYIPSEQGSDGIADDIPDIKSEVRIRMMQALIERGANINLFFYDECDALINATLNADTDTVRFLLKSGADPNYNPWPEDDPDRISQALDYASSDAFLERGTPEGDAYAEIEKLLEQYGAVIELPEQPGSVPTASQP